ncbi:MAG: hypothetical protein JWO32_568 [Bacteroidetes bacterium]|nr:hypothetical protein [Bacteroidota bacterium]
MEEKNKIYTLLLADDDMDDQYFIRKAIKEIDPEIRVISFYDGQQVVDYLVTKFNHDGVAHVTPDLIISDINMPRMNGLDLLKILKKDAELNTIPVFILTTSGDIHTKKQMLQHGAVDCLAKPHDLADVTPTISRILDKALSVNKG